MVSARTLFAVASGGAASDTAQRCPPAVQLKWGALWDGRAAGGIIIVWREAKTRLLKVIRSSFIIGPFWPAWEFGDEKSHKFRPVDSEHFVVHVPATAISFQSVDPERLRWAAPGLDESIC